MPAVCWRRESYSTITLVLENFIIADVGASWQCIGVSVSKGAQWGRYENKNLNRKSVAFFFFNSNNFLWFLFSKIMVRGGVIIKNRENCELFPKQGGGSQKTTKMSEIQSRTFENPSGGLNI